jgi:Acetyltransferase (GNAT) domain
MPIQFRSAFMPPAALIEQVAANEPANPFHTSQYVRANESLGARACFIGLCSGDELVSGCIAYLSGSFMRRGLVIHSLPGIANTEIFWRGLMGLCRELRVWNLQVDTYASPAGTIPHLRGELARRSRCEHVLDLDGEDVLAGASTQHRRNVARAVKAGLYVRRTRETIASEQHLELIDASLARRADRGENVRGSAQNTRSSALLASGAGELFQAIHENRVLSSVLVLRASEGAYYESAGTLPEGMKLGASSFLITQVAAILKHEGARVFNLGGATADDPGLLRFKTGFGTREVALEAASFCPRSAIQTTVHTALRTGVGWIKEFCRSSKSTRPSRAIHAP